MRIEELELLNDLKGRIDPEIRYEKTSPVINENGKLEGLNPLCASRQKTLERWLKRIAELEAEDRRWKQYPIQTRIEGLDFPEGE